MTHPRISALKRTIAALLACAAVIGTPSTAKPASQHARNVIVFLNDADGLPTLNAAGILAHDKPQSLYIQSMPHIGLSDTSSSHR